MTVVEKPLSSFFLLVLFQSGWVKSLGIAPGLVQTVSTLHVIEVRRRLDGLCHSNALCIDCARTATNDWDTVICKLTFGHV
jgi:hypothetical protein